MRFLILTCSLATVILASPWPTRNLNNRDPKIHDGSNSRYFSNLINNGVELPTIHARLVPGYYNIQDVADAINSGRV
jgi:hypothetical protein